MASAKWLRKECICDPGYLADYSPWKRDIRFISFYAYFTFKRVSLHDTFVFFSDSVERSIRLLARLYTHLVHILRKPPFPFFPPNDDKYPLPLN